MFVGIQTFGLISLTLLLPDVVLSRKVNKLQTKPMIYPALGKPGGAGEPQIFPLPPGGFGKPQIFPLPPGKFGKPQAFPTGGKYPLKPVTGGTYPLKPVTGGVYPMKPGAMTKPWRKPVTGGTYPLKPVTGGTYPLKPVTGGVYPMKPKTMTKPWTKPGMKPGLMTKPWQKPGGVRPMTKPWPKPVQAGLSRPLRPGGGSLTKPWTKPGGGGMTRPATFPSSMTKPWPRPGGGGMTKPWPGPINGPQTKPWPIKKGGGKFVQSTRSGSMADTKGKCPPHKKWSETAKTCLMSSYRPFSSGKVMPKCPPRMIMHHNKCVPSSWRQAGLLQSGKGNVVKRAKICKPGQRYSPFLQACAPIKGGMTKNLKTSALAGRAMGDYDDDDVADDDDDDDDDI